MSTAAEWWAVVAAFCAVVAELIVAGVIYVEFEYNRRMKFIEESTSKQAADDRFTIYKEFCEMQELTLSGKSKSFAKRLRSDLDKDQELRTRCERQLALLNNLGFETSRPFSINRDLKKLFPHGPVRMGIILHDYMDYELRRCGPLNAKYAMKFMLECLEIVKKFSKPICVAYGSKEFPVQSDDLRSLEQDLTTWVGRTV